MEPNPIQATYKISFIRCHPIGIQKQQKQAQLAVHSTYNALDAEPNQ